MLFYITFENLNSTGYAGIRKKIIAQSKTLEKVFGTTFYTYWNFDTAFLMHDEIVLEREIAVARKDYKDVLIMWLKKYDVTRTYVRYPFADKFFVEFLKYQKESGIKNVLEIPTYPYDAELNGRKKIEDNLYRKKVNQYIEKIVTYSADKRIWEIDCITLMNGVDTDLYDISKRNANNEMTMIASAGEFAYWNGFERIIEGLNIYQNCSQDYNVKLLLVGRGGDEKYYRQLVEKYGLEDRVIFAGWLTGDELDQIYEQADIAISSLGVYRLKLDVSCPIKGAEYCARGLPMVCGYKDSRFSDNPFFILQVPNDSSAIDIEEIVDFYSKIRKINNYKELIRQYAVENLTWDKIMSPVIEFLK